MKEYVTIQTIWDVTVTAILVSWVILMVKLCKKWNDAPYSIKEKGHLIMEIKGKRICIRIPLKLVKKIESRK